MEEAEEEGSDLVKGELVKTRKHIRSEACLYHEEIAKKIPFYAKM